MYITVAAAAATRSPAGRSQPSSPAPRASRLLRLHRCRDAFFKAAFSSGLETKERIGTECQRPTVLGRNFYLFFSTIRVFICLYYIILCECVHTDICIICDIVAPHTRITRVVSAGIYYQTGINKLLLINHKVILMTSYTKYRFKNYNCSIIYYYDMRIMYFGTILPGRGVQFE